ncbi:hypothetical protein ACXR2U_18170 [Jatrophihabitans sp. YIM 134969]
MTAASSGSSAATADAGPRPRLLTAAAILLGVTAILGFLLPLSLYTDRTYVGCSVAVNSANATPTATVSGTPTPQPKVTPRASTNAQIRDQIDGCINGTGPVAKASDGDTSSVLSRQLLSGVLPLLVLGALGLFAFRGVPIVRWFIVGVWFVSNLFPLVPFSILQLTSLFSGGLPALFVVVFILGVITFTAATVLVNVPVVTRYLNARRPVRPARAGGGGLFGPRPPRTAPASGPTSSSSTVSMDKPPAPAATRPPNKGKGPGGGSGNTGRAKGKRRG